jgi:hypothetical protein
MPGAIAILIAVCSYVHQFGQSRFYKSRGVAHSTALLVVKSLNNIFHRQALFRITQNAKNLVIMGFVKAPHLISSDMSQGSRDSSIVA